MSWAARVLKKVRGVAAPDPLNEAKPDCPTLTDFLSNVLPAQGCYCVFTLSDAAHYWFSSVSEMVDFIESLGNRTDIYYAVATFKQAGTRESGRKQGDVALLKCFRLDLDAGEKKLKTQGPDKVYQDRPQALQALEAFTQTTGLIPTYTISSGEGLHVYYVLSEEVAGAQWQPVAKAFHKFCTAHGLKVDASVTANHAGVLRPIGTRHPNGKTVEVLA